MRYLGHTCILKLFVVYLNFNLTGHPVFYPANLDGGMGRENRKLRRVPKLYHAVMPQCHCTCYSFCQRYLPLRSHYVTLQASAQVLTPKSISWLSAHFFIMHCDIDAFPLTEGKRTEAEGL